MKMEFEDMKVIWDAQSQEPAYVVNQDGLQAILARKAKEFKRLVFWQEALTYGSAVFVISMISLALTAYFTGVLERLKGVAMTSWDGAALVIGIICWAQFGIRVFVSRRRQRAKDEGPPGSLLGELDRDIKKVDYEIGIRDLWTLIRAYIPPHSGGILFTWVVFRATGIPGWAMIPFIGVMITGFICETRMQRRMVADVFQPRKDELEALRHKLTEADCSGGGC